MHSIDCVWTGWSASCWEADGTELVAEVQRCAEKCGHEGNVVSRCCVLFFFLLVSNVGEGLRLDVHV